MFSFILLSSCDIVIYNKYILGLCPHSGIQKKEVSSGGSDGKESACDVGDPGSTSGLGRSPGEGNGSHSSILAWEIPGTEESGELHSMGSQRVEHTERLTLPLSPFWHPDP
ncbi:unnamed protein product [Rangifer tarandus platyrhynchus]|uniref:Uncharacterized protein n=2 Tax=Rangifer tarandus platyrhynchus TaxID=3082113 RepID=A0AC59YTF4_RANTA|nr:unnamed protein product [Rangifer tarandus platyrhynchus]